MTSAMPAAPAGGARLAAASSNRQGFLRSVYNRGPSPMLCLVRSSGSSDCPDGLARSWSHSPPGVSPPAPWETAGSIDSSRTSQRSNQTTPACAACEKPWGQACAGAA